MRRFGLAAWVSVTACGPGADRTPCPPGGAHLVLATTDYESGALATVNLDDGCVADPIATSGTDPLVRAWADTVVVADRTGGDAVRVYRPGDYAAPVAEFVADPGGNLHDVAPVGDELWFALYERDHLVRTDLGGRALGDVDLRAWSDADGIPEADRLVETDAGLFVSLQRLDRADGFAPAEDGLVVRLDPSTGASTGTWSPGPNPKLAADPSDPRALLALTGRFFEADGALVRIAPDATGADADVDGVTTVVDEQDLGFDLSGLAGLAGGSASAVVLGVDFDVGGPSRIACVDLATGAVTDGATSAGWFVDAVPGPDGVYVAARSGWSGTPVDAVFAVDPATCDVVELATGFTLDPYGLAWVDPAGR